MIKDEFNYELFANLMAKTALGYIADDFNNDEKEYIVNNVSSFSYKAGKIFSNEEDVEYTASEAKYFIEIISEWSFYKSLDIVYSGIPNEYRDSVMQNIMSVVLDVLKQSKEGTISETELLDTVEQQVGTVYKQEIDDLLAKNYISESVAHRAYEQNSIELKRMFSELDRKEKIFEYIKKEMVKVFCGCGLTALGIKIIDVMNNGQSLVLNRIYNILFENHVLIILFALILLFCGYKYLTAKFGINRQIKKINQYREKIYKV